jgi:hypothetical protein
MGSNILRRKKYVSNRTRVHNRSYSSRSIDQPIYWCNNPIGNVVNEKELREGDGVNVFV